MRSFTEVLTESKKTYEFKIGVAGPLPESFTDRLETCLRKYNISNITSGKKTPIQERPLDFPQLSNMEVTYFELAVEYPTTSQVLQEYIAKCCGCDQAHIIVRNANDPREEYQEMDDKTPYVSKLETEDMGGESAQDSVAGSRVMSLLKELETAQKEDKHSGAEGAPVGESTDEGPMGMAPPAMSPPAPEMDKGTPVSVNVSMNASGKEHVADLLDMMKNAGLGDAAPAADAMMSPRMDMERLSGIMGKPADGLDDKEMNLPAIADLDGGEDESYANEMDEGQFKREMTDDAQQMDLIDFVDKYSDYGEEEASAMWHDMNEEAAADMDMDDEEEDLAADMDMDDEEAETEDMSGEGSYTIKVKGKDMDSQNELARIASLSGVAAPQEMETEADDGGFSDATTEPNAKYGDMSDAIPDGNDLNRKKKSYPATADGDNPMAVETIKAALYAALTEKKAKPDFLDVDKDGDKKEPMKKALKDKGGKPKKGKVPPQFQKEEMTAEGRGKKKPKLMAGRGRGK